ncbi:MAG: RNA methyltransferase [Aphanocapsa feldmannii 277cV]|uniref:RNA methyltransferase n=1 Tax=Aphanocapsa feldmannii 277cV TaxID=2507553 RepID=A0A524RL18_9CHRO|nr:MAG: RNA methyltransferase [Aphanocapsa feldmannii 288cV]TGG90570.1 MAG: RNA methyltransferase [Aphanocapsa feldmannii 277cV]
MVLVGTAGPLNLGVSARLCANFAIPELRLVAPRCRRDDPQALQMAVHAAAWLERAREFPDLCSALADCGRVAAASARLQPEPLPLATPQELAPWLARGGSRPTALVFGREDHGLQNSELLLAGKVLRLPTDPGYASMNLASAIAAVLASLSVVPLAQTPATASSVPMPSGPTTPQQLCSSGDLSAALSDAGDLLLEVGFLLPHTARARMAKLETLLRRAELSTAELALLRGMVRQLRWGIRRRAVSDDLPD